ncbi:peroxisomal membrane protein 13 isoform X3 [Elaeis guineensis]|uniref:peroxisomal membrane protein 13 isoform X3 n=1 Tax=Elaeis guineensis var. tenera TaxID=51953 RepID=UPI003C6D12E8
MMIKIPVKTLGAAAHGIPQRGEWRAPPRWLPQRAAHRPHLYPSNSPFTFKTVRCRGMACAPWHFFGVTVERKEESKRRALDGGVWQASSWNITPPKHWQQVGSLSAPFKPPSPGSTSNVVEASGTAKPGVAASGAEGNESANWSALGKSVRSRPWEQNNGNSYGGRYVSTMNYNSGYGSGMYNSYGGFGGSYGGGLYGNSMYTGSGGLRGGSGVYLGSMYNSRFGGPVNGYGMAMGSPYGNLDPNNLYGPPPSLPGFWMSFIRVAFHMFMSALLQLFDRSGLLYGELARFVLKLLGVRTKPGRHYQLGPGELVGPNAKGQHHVEGPNSTNGSWDTVWGENLSKETS